MVKALKHHSGKAAKHKRAQSDAKQEMMDVRKAAHSNPGRYMSPAIHSRFHKSRFHALHNLHADAMAYHRGKHLHHTKSITDIVASELMPY